MPGCLVAGVVVGPALPGPYVTEHVDDVRQFTELGVPLLLFVIGLEMKPSRLWAMRRELFGLGSAQIPLTGLVMMLYVSLSSSVLGSRAADRPHAGLCHQPPRDATAARAANLPAKHGTGTFAILLMQDLAVVPLFVLVPPLSGSVTIGGAVPLWEQLLILAGYVRGVGGVWRAGRARCLEWLARHGNREGFLLVVLTSVFLAAGDAPGRTVDGSGYLHHGPAAVRLSLSCGGTRPGRALQRAADLFFVAVGCLSI